MKIIVGLGNPGTEYEGTRHNAGFMFLDKLVALPELASVDGPIKFLKEKKFESEIAETIINGERLILVKPQTFMNLSGSAVLKISRFYKATTEDLIVISDDIDLPIGTARVRLEGSSGGHKGLQSIFDLMGTDKVVRIRIGVDSIEKNRRTEYQTNQFVLEKPSDRELPVLDQVIDEVIKYSVQYLGQKEPMSAHTLEIKFDSQE